MGVVCCTDVLSLPREDYLYLCSASHIQLTVDIDSTDQVHEANEANNLATLTVTRPDSASCVSKYTDSL